MEKRGCQREEERLSGHYLLGKRERQKLVYFLIQAATTSAGKIPLPRCPMCVLGHHSYEDSGGHLSTELRFVAATFSVLSSVKVEGGGAS